MAPVVVIDDATSFKCGIPRQSRPGLGGSQSPSGFENDAGIGGKAGGGMSKKFNHSYHQKKYRIFNTYSQFYHTGSPRKVELVFAMPLTQQLLPNQDLFSRISSDFLEQMPKHHLVFGNTSRSFQ